MAFDVIHGAGREVTSARPEVSRISHRAVNLRNELVKGGARILGTMINSEGIEISWLPAGASPDLEPILSSIVHSVSIEIVDQVDLEDEEIPVRLDAPAIASLEAEAAERGVVSLEAWRASREH